MVERSPWYTPAKDALSKACEANEDLAQMLEENRVKELTVASIGLILAIRQMSTKGVAPKDLEGLGTTNATGFWYREVHVATPRLNDYANILLGEEDWRTGSRLGGIMEDAAEHEEDMLAAVHGSGLLTLKPSTPRTSDEKIESPMMDTVLYSEPARRSHLFHISVQRLSEAGLSEEYDELTAKEELKMRDKA